MADFVSDHRTVSEEMYLEFPPGIVWPQLCPTREYDWIEHWDCELVRSTSGYNELDCVFRTDFPGEGGRETWVTCRFEPCRVIEFVRVNEVRAIRFVIELEPDGQGTRIRWTQHVTPLKGQGNEYVKNKAESFRVQMEMARRFLAHYLETGQMLKGETSMLDFKSEAHVHGR